MDAGLPFKNRGAEGDGLEICADLVDEQAALEPRVDRPDRRFGASERVGVARFREREEAGAHVGDLSSSFFFEKSILGMILFILSKPPKSFQRKIRALVTALLLQLAQNNRACVPRIRESPTRSESLAR